MYFIMYFMVLNECDCQQILLLQNIFFFWEKPVPSGFDQNLSRWESGFKSLH